MATKRVNEGKDAGLESLRAKIDECDRQIIELLARRFELVRQIGIYKANHNLPVVDEARETDLLLDRRRQSSAGRNYSVDDIFKLILEESRQIQMSVRDDLSQGKPDSQY